jgi:hypothetical protein
MSRWRGKRKHGKGEVDFEEEGQPFVSEEEVIEAPPRPKSAAKTPTNLFIKEKKLTLDKTLTELTKSLTPSWNDMSDLQKAVSISEALHLLRIYLVHFFGNLVLHSCRSNVDTVLMDWNGDVLGLYSSFKKSHGGIVVFNQQRQVLYEVTVSQEQETDLLAKLLDIIRTYVHSISK